jgi:hypothetical protein
MNNTRTVRRDCLYRVLIVAALSILIAACSTSRALESVSANDNASDSRIWPGLVPPAKEHVALRLPEIDSLKPLDGGVLFIGDSITEGAPLFAMFPRLSQANYGIGWDTSDGVLLRLDQIRRNRPDRAFILIGTNDINYAPTSEGIAKNVQSIVAKLSTDMPDTEFYVISILPREKPNNAVLDGANAILKSGAASGGYVYLDLASHVRAADGTLRKDLTFDGLHLNVHGYAVWSKVLETCVWKGCSEVVPVSE